MIILGSRSPRRRELLSLLLPQQEIIVFPPPDEKEAGFLDVRTPAQIRARVTEIAHAKLLQAAAAVPNRDWDLIVTADTVVVATEPDGQSTVLGQPPRENWQTTVRNWFLRYYSDRAHEVVTAVCLRTRDGKERRLIEQTTIRFHPISEPLLNWYLSTGEPVGKAGGYGLQGAGSVFVQTVIGSSSNVIGLPLEPLWKTLNDWGFTQTNSASSAN